MFSQCFNGHFVKQSLRFIRCHKCFPFLIIGIYLQNTFLLDEIFTQNLGFQKTSKVDQLLYPAGWQNSYNLDQHLFIIPVRDCMHNLSLMGSCLIWISHENAVPPVRKPAKNSTTPTGLEGNHKTRIQNETQNDKHSWRNRRTACRETVFLHVVRYNARYDNVECVFYGPKLSFGKTRNGIHHV